VNALAQGYAEMAFQGRINRLNGQLVDADQQLAAHNATIDQLLFDKAYLFAQRAAVEAQFLRLVGRDHPIWDKTIRSGIGNAGVTAWNMTRDWEAVKEAGRSFALPDGPDLHKDCPSREQADADSLRLGVLMGLYKKLEGEVASLTKSCAQHMAQAAAFRQQLTAVDPTNPLATDGSLRQRVADRAYEELAATNFKDWSVVRQVGASFVSDSERERCLHSVEQTQQHVDPDLEDHQDPPWLEDHLRELDLQVGAAATDAAASGQTVPPASS